MLMAEKFQINFDELKHAESWKEFDEKLTIKSIPNLLQESSESNC